MAESSLVEAAATKLGISFIARQVDTRGHMASGLSLETAAREARYEALRSAAGATGARLIAVGHTADDQVETVLMHEFRGSGLSGMAGMEVVSGDLLRPLLDITHADAARYCRLRELAFVEDESNRDLVLRRNWVRHELLPVMERAFPGVRQAVLRLSASARRDVRHLRSLAAEALPEIAGEENIVPELWRGLPESIRYHTLLLFRDQAGLEVSERAVEEHAARLLIARSYRGPPRQSQPPFLTTPLTNAPPIRVPGRTPVGGVTFHAALFSNGPERLRRAALSSPWFAYFDRDRVGSISVRLPQEGDRVRPFGGRGTRKLREVFIDAHVAPERRDRVAIVESRGAIIWVPGLLRSDVAPVSPKTDEVVAITVST